MANAISNHFCLTALQEGVTVQGSLRVAGALSQNYNANTGKCIPDWKADATIRPTVYPVIRRGAAYLPGTAIVGGTWLYNDNAIQFDANNLSTNFLDAAGNPLFEAGTTTVSLNGALYAMPRLTMVANLASASNIDLDTIGFRGSVEVAGKPVDFAAQVDVKIAQMTSQGYLGVLSPESAIVSQQTDTVTIQASLFGEDGGGVTTWFTKWYNVGTGQEITAAVDAKQLTIAGSEFTDNIVIRCDFFLDAAHTNRVTSAFASIDDIQDPEYLYVSYNNGSADFSGQLSPGESCEVTAWVATMDDATAINTEYTNFAVKFYDGQQNEITASAPIMTTSAHKGTVTIPYNFIADHGYKIFGYVTAS